MVIQNGIRAGKKSETTGSHLCRINIHLLKWKGALARMVCRSLSVSNLNWNMFGPRSFPDIEPSTCHCWRKNSTKALVFWTEGFVTLQINVSLCSSISAALLGVGILTGGRRTGNEGSADHFPFSTLDKRCAIVQWKKLPSRVTVVNVETISILQL